MSIIRELVILAVCLPSVALAESAAEWKSVLSEKIEMNGDGSAEAIQVLQKGTDKIEVQISTEGQSDSSFTFPLAKHTTDSFCGVPKKILKEDGIPPLKEWGCKVKKPSDKCKHFIKVASQNKKLKGIHGIALDDELCDKFHFMWDSVDKKYIWWRN